MKVMMKGCYAIAEAAVRAGCRFFAGYPITPQNEIPEYFSQRLPEVGGVFVQGESELASISMVTGAAAAGARAMTSSSGPGLSLKSEGISGLCANHVPAVICNAMRGGPGTGSIQGAQSDYFQATKGGGHGGYRMIVFAPSTIQEAVDCTYKAFDYADRDLNPVLILVDGYVASMSEPVELPKMIDYDINSRAYAVKGNDRGRGKRVIISQGTLNAEDIETYNRNMARMHERWQKEDVQVEEYRTADAELIIVAYGTAARIARDSVDTMRERGVKVGMIRPITVSPFPYETLEKLDPAQVKKVLVVEMTIPPQMAFDVKIGLNGKIPIECYGRSGGMLVDNDEIEEILERISKEV